MNLKKELKEVDSIIKEKQYLKDILLKMMFYFNLFERNFINVKYGMKKRLRIFSNKNNVINIDDIFNFFRNRYVDNNGEIKEKNFNDLFRTEIDELWENCVKENLLIKKEKLFTVLSISYRFRNNLFHGNHGKEPHNLENYKECFENINKLFKIILSFEREPLLTNEKKCKMIKI